MSDIILQGCQPIIVEGVSDQFYLNAIKNYLIRSGTISPKRELVFVPAGGVRGIGAIVSILTGKDEALPFVVLDSDSPGQDTASKLKKDLYRGANERVHLVGDLCHMDNAEVEDLLPVDLLAGVVTKYLRGPDEDFDEVVSRGQPIVPQIEAYADQNGLELEKGWKVEVAKLTKTRLLREASVVEQDVIARWTDLFTAFDG